MATIMKNIFTVL